MTYTELSVMGRVCKVRRLGPWGVFGKASALIPYPLATLMLPLQLLPIWTSSHRTPRGSPQMVTAHIQIRSMSTAQCTGQA